jgi:hypothetical protein
MPPATRRVQIDACDDAAMAEDPHRAGTNADCRSHEDGAVSGLPTPIEQFCFGPPSSQSGSRAVTAEWATKRVSPPDLAPHSSGLP